MRLKSGFTATYKNRLLKQTPIIIRQSVNCSTLPLYSVNSLSRQVGELLKCKGLRGFPQRDSDGKPHPKILNLSIKRLVK